MRLSPPVRLLMGTLLLALSHYLMGRPDPALIRFQVTEALNRGLALGLTNKDHVLLATLALLAGALVLASGLAHMPLGAVPARIPVGQDVLAGARGPVALLALAALLFGVLIWRVTTIKEPTGLGWLWLGVLGLSGAALWQLDRSAGTALSPGLEWRDSALIGVLVVFGLLVGTYQLQRLPNSMMGDEGQFWDMAEAIATGESRPSVFTFGVYSYPMLSSIYQGAVLKLFGLSLWSWRFSSVLAAVGAVVPTYMLARELFDRRVAVLAGLALLTLPYFLAFARLGYNNAQALLPTALALYLLYAGWRRGSVLYMGLSGMVAGLGFYTYTAARLALVVAALFLAYLLLRGLVRTRFRSLAEGSGAALALGLSFGVGWAVTALPHLAFGSAWYPDLLRYKLLESLFPNVVYARSLFTDQQLFRDAPPIMVGAETFFYRLDLYVLLLLRGLVRTLLAIDNGTLIGEHYIAGPLAGPVTAIFFIIGLVAALVQIRRPQSVLLLLWLVSGLVLLSIIDTFPPRHQHLVALIPAFAICIGFGIARVGDGLRDLAPGLPRLPDEAQAAIITIAVASGLWQYYVTVQHVYPPSAENIMAFDALELRQSQQLIYVSSRADVHFVPWMIEHMPNNAMFRVVRPDQLDEVKQRLVLHHGDMIYLAPEEREVIEPLIWQLIGSRAIPDLHLDSRGQVVLIAYTFGGVQQSGRMGRPID